jgi:preprotein translocase subunit YajC
MNLFLAIVVLFFVAGWFFLVLPARRRRHSHEAMQDAVAVGDEIISAGGIHAVVKETGDADLLVEIAPGVVVKLDRRAIAAVAVAEEPEPEPEPEPAEAPEDPDAPDPAPEADPGAS